MEKQVEKIKDDEKIQKTKKKNRFVVLKVLLILILSFLLLISIGALFLWEGIPRKHKIEERVYEEDYAVIYSEEIKIVFGPDCKVGEKKDITSEGESCSCGYHRDTYIYDEWEITYKDQYGQTFVQTMNNMESFEEQQIEWMTNQMEEHYKTTQLKDYFDQSTLEGFELEQGGRSYVYVFYGNPISGWSTDEDYKEMSEGDSKERAYTKELTERLSNPENMIHLYQLDYSQVYKSYPIRVSISLEAENMDITAEEVAKSKAEYQEKMNAIAQEIIKESGDSCHMRISLDVAYNETQTNQYGHTSFMNISCENSYVGGKEVDFTNTDKDYDQLLLYWYNENIW